MRNLSFFLCLLLLPALSAPSSAHADKQYRCNGRIQYYPCTDRLVFDYGSGQWTYRKVAVKAQPSSKNVSLTKSQARPVKVVPADHFAEVLAPSYAPTTQNRGWWRGKVRGKGLVELYLSILRDGSVEARHFMGEVSLVNETTYFSFKGPRPAGANWAWQIEAAPRSVVG